MSGRGAEGHRAAGAEVETGQVPGPRSQEKHKLCAQVLSLLHDHQTSQFWLIFAKQRHATPKLLTDSSFSEY